jgi:hypothetical protein
VASGPFYILLMQICYQYFRVLLGASETHCIVQSAFKFVNCRIILRLLSDTLSLPETKFHFADVIALRGWWT